MKYVPISRSRLIAALNIIRQSDDIVITEANIRNIFVFEDNLPIEDNNADLAILMIEIAETGE